MQLDGILCLLLKCEFVNYGAKPGSIDDIFVRMIHLETGSVNGFVPYLVRDRVNIFQGHRTDDFLTFSGIALGANQRRELYVVFQPNQKNFEPPNGVVIIRTEVCTNIKANKYIESPIRISLNLDNEIVSQWISPTGASQEIPAMEIGEGRREHLKKRSQK